MHNKLPLITRTTTVLFVIDLQDKLLPAIHEGEAVVAAANRLIRAARLLGVPLLATEQYPAGLGPTCTAVRETWGDVKAVEKLRFSGCVDEVMAALADYDRPCVLITGVEAHVCVQQSVLDLLRRGYAPIVCADAVSSRRAFDRDIALERMRDAGAVITTSESAIFELLGQAGTDEFKQVLKIVK